MNNYTQWSATGSRKSKMKFLSLLARNGVKAFDGRKTAKRILRNGEDIKGVDYNRQNKKGAFFISTDRVDYKLTMNFDLDNVDLEWALKFIIKI